MEKEKEFRVVSHTFMGAEEYEGVVYGYRYEITFNRSLQHTGRFRGIENGLNAYVKQERRNAVKNAFKTLWWAFVQLINRRKK